MSIITIIHLQVSEKNNSKKGRIMGTIILIIIAIVAFNYLRKSMAERNAATGGYDTIISHLKAYYGTVRQNRVELGADVISISTYWISVNGKSDSSSGALSVCVTEGKNDRLAESLGMRVTTINGKRYYQFIVHINVSRTVKREILRKLAPELKKLYPNDVIQFDEKIPAVYSMVDSQNILDMLNRVR